MGRPDVIPTLILGLKDPPTVGAGKDRDGQILRSGPEGPGAEEGDVLPEPVRAPTYLVANHSPETDREA